PEFDDKIITLGITPSRPETCYRYIQYKQNGDQSNEIRKVKTFTEKPQYELAVKFIDSGDFLWNAGIFISSVKTLVSSFNKHLPDVATIFHNGSQHYYTDSENGFIKEAYSMCPNISMDYGIMEKADNVYVIEADMGWSDIGTWSALFDNSEKNQENNLVNSDNIYTYDVDNCIIRIEKNKVAVIQGLENYIVIDEGDALLICKIDNEQNIKNYVEKIKKDKKFTYL
ncbi:MAG: sugar phosphate nucleotidyltransferase, partial [Lentimicrobiaceae bacterium]|nr:sugar phosphate nucleotidyltransferase [Lentimicrobiaceae bacterium]